MFKILFQLDDLDNIEANLIAEAANRLGVGEFQFFQVAFQAWHGYEIEPKQLEQDFLAYMTQDQVPPWARHFARRVIKDDDAAELDRNDEKFHRHDRFGPKMNYGWRENMKAFLLVLFVAGFLIFVLYHYEQAAPEKYRCNFPPCADIF